jgi:hypothetical protein
MKLDREAIRRKLPHNLDDIAKDTGALRRRREIKSAEQLVWMTLIYSGLVGPSLRQTAALGGITGDFKLNDTSVRYRLSNAAEFLTAVLNSLLFGADRALRAEGVRRRLCLQDATTVSIPGSKGTDFRLHTEYVPGQGLAYVEITDRRGGESLERGEYGAGDIVIADQGLAYASSIHHACSTGAYCLVRAYLQNIKLQDEDGVRLIPERILDFADQGASSISVLVPYEDAAPLKARLVMTKLPAEAAARAREKLRKRASKKQKSISKLAMRLAGYVMILTTVPASELSDSEVLHTYRLRWQIELFFKRCKSLLGLDELKAGGRVAQAWLLGKMIIATLIDRALAKIYREWSYEGSGAAPNLWPLTKLCLMDLQSTILDVERVLPSLDEAALQRLGEAPRKRKTAATAIARLNAKLNPSARQGRP